MTAQQRHSDGARSAGRFITFEGGEGAGKSTQIERLAGWLSSRVNEVVVSREPGGTSLGEAVRGVLMGEYDKPTPAMSELLLVFAARAAHLAQVIEPALARGAWVICDRFTDASYAYQGAARGLGDAAVAQLETLVQGETRPDAVLLFDLPVEAGLARARSRGKINRFDREAARFHETVRQAYLARAAAFPDRYHLIDATGDAEAVQDMVQKALSQWL